MNITLYYDDSCTLCTTNAIEMQAKNPDDITIMSVDDGLLELNQAGISRTEAMTYVCVQDNQGTVYKSNIYKGIDAIRLLCKVANVNHAWLLHMPIIKQFTTFSYPFFARNRYYFPQWAIRLLYGSVTEAGNEPHKDTNSSDNISENICENGVCHIPPHKRKDV